MVQIRQREGVYTLHHANLPVMERKTWHVLLEIHMSASVKKSHVSRGADATSFLSSTSHWRAEQQEPLHPKMKRTL